MQAEGRTGGDGGLGEPAWQADTAGAAHGHHRERDDGEDQDAQDVVVEGLGDG